MLKKLHLLTGILIAIFLLISHLNFQVKAEEKTIIEIAGVIKNMKDAKKYLLKDSYLFLLKRDEDVKITLSAFAQKVIVTEGFPKTNIADEGSFSFKIDTLAPGKYMILSQPIQGFTLGGMSYTLIVSEKTKEVIEIEISGKDNKSIKLNLGEVFIKCPETK